MKNCLLLLTFIFASPLWATQKLVLVGGGARPPEALKKFVSWAHSSAPQVLIITWATNSPEESFDSLKMDFAPWGAQAVHAETAPLNAAKKKNFLVQLSRADAVFFSGGDQNRIMDVLSDSELLSALLSKYQAGTVFGGTSAGTAVAAQLMMTGESDLTVIDANKVQTRPGLGLLTDVILDQHFLVRQRENRLFALVLAHVDQVGLGIDQDTAVAIENGNQAEVFGATQVMRVRMKAKSLVLDLYKAGQTFQIH